MTDSVENTIILSKTFNPGRKSAFKSDVDSLKCDKLEKKALQAHATTSSRFPARL